jgi:hypothetical protein
MNGSGALRLIDWLTKQAVIAVQANEISFNEVAQRFTAYDGPERSG